MQAFLIHRTRMRSEAQSFLSSLRSRYGIHIEPTFLRKSYGSKWKQQAESAISTCELVVVYDSEACAGSDNTKWEIERAQALEKQIVYLTREDISNFRIGVLQSAYDFNEEFESCFRSETTHPEQLLELYRIMVASSEQLVQRRQITNGFFFTAVSAIVGSTGFLIKEQIVTDASTLFLLFPIVIGLLMCRSWGNLIENYGKLNAGKFRVINRIETQLEAQIFFAEWIALGKGVRREKYQSFTNTEKHVPKYFGYLLWTVFLYVLIATNWTQVGDRLSDVWSFAKGAVDAFFALFASGGEHGGGAH